MRLAVTGACVGPALLCLALWALGLPALANAEPAGRLWRVCVTDTVLPPFLNNDPANLGLTEQLLLDSARQQGLTLELLRYPPKRCRLLMRSGGIDATFAAPVADNLAEMQFPMRGSEVDSSRRLIQIRMVWVKRPDSSLDWDGEHLLGAAPQTLMVGTRPTMRVLHEPLLALGFKLDDSAFTGVQLLHKLRARRIDLAVASQEEVEFAQREPALRELRVLAKPLLLADFYLVAVLKRLPTERQAQLTAWWDSIAALRDQEKYRPR